MILKDFAALLIIVLITSCNTGIGPSTGSNQIYALSDEASKKEIEDETGDSGLGTGSGDAAVAIWKSGISNPPPG